MTNNITPVSLANITLQKIKKQKGKIEFPIDPFELLKENNVLIAFFDFDNLEGIILNDEDNVSIVGINRLRPHTRQRFTAAHEYCHYIKDLRKNINEINRIDCMISSDEEIEKFANKFASELLMPMYKLKELCENYKNDKGYIDFENVLIISNFFAVSFESCLYRIAYKLKMIDGDTSHVNLKNRVRKFQPNKKKLDLLENNNDSLILGKYLNSLSYPLLDLNKNTGVRFLNNYIYNDNKLEGIEQNDISYILTDLSFNKQSSKYYNSNNENIIMTLGNKKMQEYVLNTKDEFNINKCVDLHKMLYSYAKYSQYSGIYRSDDAIILRGTIQPISYLNIRIKLLELEQDFKEIDLNNNNVYEYIKDIVSIMYRFIVIHPFSDGNGRISRALLNWMLRLNNLPPIYIDDKSRKDYYDALSIIDTEYNFEPMILLIEKRIIKTSIELHDYLFLD